MLKFLQDTDEDQLAMERYIQKSQNWHGARATAFVQNYQLDRFWKQNYILVNVIAEGYDQKRFSEALMKAKNSTPNVDFFTRAELKEVVAKFKEDADNGLMNESSMRSSMLDNTAANLFDEIYNRRKSSKARRRQTITAKETELNKAIGCACVIKNVSQYITSQVAGYVRSQSQMVTIDTYPFKWRVKRLDTDFDMLREYLLRAYPQCIIPPLPRKKNKKLSARQLLKRHTYYGRFLNCILKSHVLKSCPFVVEFLKETDQEAFNLRLLTAEEDLGPRNIYNFKTISGDINVEVKDRDMKFCEQLGPFSKQYEKINAYIAKKCKVLQAKSHELADDYYAIGAEINHFAELLKPAEIPQVTNLYKRMSDLVVRNGDFTLHSGELVNASLNSWFKYQRQESQSFKEAYWLRDESIRKYNQMRKELHSKKMTLWKSKDVASWEVPPDKLGEALAVKNDATKSFEFMLPKQSRQVQYLKEESNYFTAQAYKEVRRTTMMDYCMAREHFVDMGEQMVRHIYDINQGWGSMLDFYSDMNNARKEFDDKYVERTFIGEELDELDANELSNIEENKQQDMNQSTTNILAELQSEDRQNNQQKEQRDSMSSEMNRQMNEMNTLSTSLNTNDPLTFSNEEGQASYQEPLLS